MTLLSSLARITVATSTGATSIPVPFTVQRNDDLLVYRTPSGGSATLLIYGTHYSIADIGEASSVILLVTPAVAGDTYLLARVIDVVQELNLRNQGNYLPETLEKSGLDRIVMMIQQMEVLLSTVDPSLARALLLGVNDIIGTGAYDALSNRIKNLDNPTADQDAATKLYVDTAVGGAVGGGSSFVLATVTAASLPSPSVVYDGLVYRVRDAGLPDILKCCVRQSDGATYEWTVIAAASA